MEFWNNRELKARASQGLEPQAASVRTLVLIYTGVLAALSIGINGLNLILDTQIGTTGGIGGLGLRSVLQTVQEILGYINTFFAPFWSAGFLYAMLMTFRGQTGRPKDLLEGFRRFGRILGGIAFQYLAIIMVTIIVANVTTLLTSFTNWERKVMEIMEPMLENPDFYSNDTFYLDALPMDQMLTALAPFLILFSVLLLAAYIFMSYHFRMATYLMMEREIGGSRAHFLSARLLSGYKWKLLKLDLSFWWYYLLNGIISVVAVLDVILVLLGFALPFGETVWFFGTLVLYCGLLLVVNLKFKPMVDCTYLAAFEAIAHPEQEPPVEAE